MSRRTIISSFVLSACILVLSQGTALSQAIAAHRGWWDSDEGGHSQNSIASLGAAQALGVWGSEFDVQLTSDLQPIVNHDPEIHGVVIKDNPLSVFKEMKLNNGEAPSTLSEYLRKGKESHCVLVMELKPQATAKMEEALIRKCFADLRSAGLLKPERVIFISFSLRICALLAAHYPQFMVQYLNGEMSPEKLHEMKIKGLDYNISVFRRHPDWVERAHKLGMQVNVWTVNKESDIQDMIDLGVDCITTNDPLLARKLLGENEIRHPGK